MPADLDRRTFIRLLAGAAAAPLAACSADYPAEAVAAWRGPDGAADLRRWALGHAILAPNSHNRQPWLVDLREPDAIVLRDRPRAPAARDRSVVPPDRRQPGHLHRGPGAGAAPARPRARPSPSSPKASSRRAPSTTGRWPASPGPQRPAPPARSAVRPAAAAAHRQGRLRHRPARSRPRRSSACAARWSTRTCASARTVEPARLEALRDALLGSGPGRAD